MPAKSKLGQNFLHDQAAIRRIVSALGDCAQLTVVEIGPGRAAVTRTLLPAAARVVAVEVDPELVSRLHSEFPADKLTVVHQDVLAFDFAAAANEAGHSLAVIGNLPYYITSPILLHLAESHAALDRAVLMMQREVADRVAAAPGSRDYGLLSITAQMYGPVERLFTLPPEAFSPPPEVHSTVIRWRFAPRFTELGVEEASFLDLVRKSFAQKRKTLANNLRASGLNPEQIATALELAGIDAQARAEAVSIETFADLWKALRATTHGNPISPHTVPAH
jgi:16S rRNA (adenine1518-N6/adenine1519-N6)-dimethyltransferase